MVRLVDFEDETLVVGGAGDLSQFFITHEVDRGVEFLEGHVFEGILNVTAQEVGHFDFWLFLVKEIGFKGGGVEAVPRGKFLFAF